MPSSNDGRTGGSGQPGPGAAVLNDSVAGVLVPSLLDARLGRDEERIAFAAAGIAALHLRLKAVESLVLPRIGLSDAEVSAAIDGLVSAVHMNPAPS